MLTRRINSIFWALATLLAAGAVAAIALGALLPLETDPSGENPSSRSTTREVHGSLPELASFEPILARNWRQSLTDAPAPLQAEAGTPNGSLTLAGTVGTSLALLRRADGTVEVKGVGESIDGAEVLAIRPREVELRGGGGEQIILRKPREPEP